MKKMIKSSIIIFIILIITTMVSESVAYFVYPLISKVGFKYSEVRKRLFTEANSNTSDLSIKEFNLADIDPKLNTNAIHPYIGFVKDTMSTHNQNYFGFKEGSECIQKKDPNKIIIAISGGSVAEQLYDFSKNIIIDQLSKYDQFKDKKIEIICFSKGGYKQPQQLMTLNYFLTLGGEFDIWINLDGFNEICLSVIDNWFRGKVALDYPASWKLLSRKSVDPKALDTIARVKNLQRERNELACFFSNIYISRSPISLVIWDLIDRKKKSGINNLNLQLEKILSFQETSFQVSGPYNSYNDDWQQAVVESVKIWKNASSQMAKICSANGISYFHFLQPNQYYQNSKSLTPEEMNLAYVQGPYQTKDVVSVGYPLLVKEGTRLVSDNIPFYDMTLLFKGVSETIYSDICCHYNQLGYDILATEIARNIIQKKTTTNGTSL